MAICFLYAADLRYIFELTIAEIVIQNIRSARQAAGTAHDWHAFPCAARAVAWFGRCRKIEVHVICDHQVQFAVSIVIYKCAAGAPFSTTAGNACCFADFCERPVRVVTEEAILTIASDIDIVIAIIVVVADARALAPACGQQARFQSDISKGSIVIVMEQVTCRRRDRLIRFQRTDH